MLETGVAPVARHAHIPLASTNMQAQLMPSGSLVFCKKDELKVQTRAE
jgi:hypothetical protein